MKRFCIVFVLAAVLCAFSACGTVTEQKQSVDEAATVETAITEDTDFVFELTREDAESLIEEKLTGKNATFEIKKDIASFSDGDYYVAEISKEGEVLTDYGLAVNTVSGGVQAFDFTNNQVVEFSEFPLYNEETDKEYSWFGSYSNDEGSRFINMEMSDSVIFEMHVSDGAKDLFVTELQPEGNTAAYQGDEFSFRVTMETEDTLIVTDEEGRSGFAGTYTLQQ